MEIGTLQQSAALGNTREILEILGTATYPFLDTMLT